MKADKVHHFGTQRELLVCPDCNLPFTNEEIEIKEHCFNCGWEFATGRK